MVKEQYWSGYFSTRPNLKKHIKDFNRDFVQSMQLFSQMYIKANKLNETELEFHAEILEMKDKMLDGIGVSLHHDAITGTSKQLVVADYYERLRKVQL